MSSARARSRFGWMIALLLAGSVTIGGCGQRGPLTLPDSARPIERQAPPAAEDDEPDDDEQR
jgi:predicted small lipoprotein YifL